MQPTLQHAEPQSDDPHDEIAALLRNHARPSANDPSELNITPADRDTPVTPSEPPSVEPLLRIAPFNDTIGERREPAARTRSRRGITGVLMTICVGIAVTVAWQTYGEAAKQRLAQFAPRILKDALAPTQSANAAEPQEPAQIPVPQPAAEPASVQAATAMPAAPAQPATTTTAVAAPAQAALQPELAKAIETMSSDIASLKQTVEKLNAAQQQLSRDVAKAAEFEARRKLAGKASKPTPPSAPQRASNPPPQAAALPAAAPYSPPQAYPQRPVYPQGQSLPQGTIQREAYIPPPPPARLPSEPGYIGVLRPPMPLQ